MEQWIKDHLADDVSRLRLRFHGQPLYAAAIDQIDCRQRCTKKIPGFLRHESFRFPSTLSAEQATSEGIAAYHASLVPDGARVLDLTCGLGIDAFTIARRASHVTAVEIDPAKVECARHNARVLGLDNFTVVNSSAEDYLAEVASGSFDIIFIDPSRRDSSGKRTFALADCSPDVSALLAPMLKVARRTLIKLSPMLDPTELRRQMGPCGITAVGTPSECRELLLEIGAGVVDTDAALTVDAPVHPASPAVSGPYLYEPYPANMKMGLSEWEGATSISVDSHLILSERYLSDFPGHIYAVERTSSLSKQDLKDLRCRFRQLRMVARGIGMTTADMRKKIGIADGDSVQKLFGVKDSEGRRLLILGQPL